MGRSSDGTDAVGSIIGLGIVFVVAWSLISWNEGGSVTSINDAVLALGGKTFTWNDDSGVNWGVPARLYEITFNKAATECTVRTKSVIGDEWEMDKGQVKLTALKNIRDGAPYVGIKCAAIVHRKKIEMNTAKYISETNDERETGRLEFPIKAHSQ